jgi:hypothetical protein
MLRQILHRFVPAHFDNPFGLAVRLLRTCEPAAMFAMGSAAAGVLTAPIDFALGPFERRLYRRAGENTGPLAFICGAPRAGTTVVHQTLVRHLSVTHFTNLTALFPMSPLMATRLAGRFLREPVPEYDSFYGRTPRLSGLNDALYLWDRWLGSNRLDARPRLSARASHDMQQFFAAWTAAAGRPLVAKCNHLNASAHLVADALPEAIFICVERDPLWLAQSLLKAREFLHGDRSRPYGLAETGSTVGDPLESVAAQVRFHADLADRQERRIGRDRFWRIRYEDFCREPVELVRRVGRALFGEGIKGQLPTAIPAHPCANRKTLDDATFHRLATMLETGHQSSATAGSPSGANRVHGVHVR